MSRLTVNIPSRPTAAPTLSLPSLRSGSSVAGLPTQPRTLPSQSDTATMPPSGPPPLMRIVSAAFSSFISCPMSEAAHSVRPSAAQAVGAQPCICLARSTVSRAFITAIFIAPSPAVALMILSIKISVYFLFAVINILPASPCGQSCLTATSPKPAASSSARSFSGVCAYSMCSSLSRDHRPRLSSEKISMP